MEDKRRYERIEKLEFTAKKHAEALLLLSEAPKETEKTDYDYWPVDNLTEEQCKIIVEVLKNSPKYVTPPYIKEMIDEMERFENETSSE